jgi:chitin-binding protein
MIMRHSLIKAFTGALALLGLSGDVFSHGLIQSPASRNWYCGAVTKPDQVANGVATYPFCRDAFADDFNGGYQFMSVLTHARGRAVVSPLPQHVCGFGSETWQGRATPWDTPINWPTTNMQAGPNKFTWNISWGPHFDDTEEFRYWITKSDFQFTVGQALKWTDFEEAPFCSLKYDDKNPGASPSVVADKPNTQFNTFCNVPVRGGRHVIYGEWGRNQFTLERFHSCVDVMFAGGGGGGSAPVANIAITPNVTQFTGAGSVFLSAAGSTGTNPQYQWSVTSPNPGSFTLENATSVNATLRLSNPPTSSNLLITLQVKNSSGADTKTFTLTHQPAAGASWKDLGAVTTAAKTLGAGDTVRLRVVRGTGQDQYFPASPLVLTAANATAAAWPQTLANAVNALTTDVQIGVLNAAGNVASTASATANRMYASATANITGTFVEIVTTPPPGGACSVKLRSGNNAYWAGLDIGATQAEIVLDFTASGLTLSQLRIDAGAFTVTQEGQLLRLKKPAWVSVTNPGYFGLAANNNPALANFTLPVCR